MRPLRGAHVGDGVVSVCGALGGSGGIAVVLVALARREREYHREDKKQGSDLQKILFHVKNLS